MVNKPTGPHKRNRLTDKAIRAISEPGRYPDGDGLYLVADHKDAKRWNLRIMVQGKRCDFGLGSFKDVTLAEARDTAREYRKVAHNGGDPDSAGPAVLYWFELKRNASGAMFIPHLIDENSGVETQLATADLDQDGKTDLGVGNKKGVFIFTSAPRKK